MSGREVAESQISFPSRVKPMPFPTGVEFTLLEPEVGGSWPDPCDCSGKTKVS